MYTDRARSILNQSRARSHKPNNGKSKRKKQEAAHQLLPNVPAPEQKCCSNMQFSNFGGKLNDTQDPDISREKSERKIIRAIYYKPKESSLRQGFIF